jgi:hypothetical protein
MSGKIILLSGFWLAAICAGSFVLLGYQNKAGESNTAPTAWPTQSKLPRPANLPTLLLFAHPHCPCTRATVGELALVMARCSSKVSAVVLFTKPVDVDDNWVETDLWRSAEAIPGVIVRRDDSGIEARRFGAVSSGDSMLYGRDGKLLFRGGITDGRGHAGDNEGRSAIVSFLEGKPGGTSRTHVFGCRLFDSHSVQPSQPICPRQP